MTASAALRVARTLQLEAKQAGCGPPTPVTAQGAAAVPIDHFAALVTDPGLRTTVEALYRNGHYAEAVEAAYKYFNNLVKQKAGSPADNKGVALDGSRLMNAAFSLDSPLLRLSDLDSQSKRDQQLGYMQVFAGVMTGVRNPRAHEATHLDEPAVALELLALANHLVRLVNASTRTRRRKAAARLKVTADAGDKGS